MSVENRIFMIVGLAVVLYILNGREKRIEAALPEPGAD